jgi:hypothetical protein
MILEGVEMVESGFPALSSEFKIKRISQKKHIIFHQNMMICFSTEIK